MELEWYNIANVGSRSFTCGYCGAPIASEKGWWAKFHETGKVLAYIYVCHKCGRPSFFDIDGKQTPGVAYGNPVNNIPNADVNSLYTEARDCTGCNAFTAAVLCCRKLLMNIAISKGAAKDKKFIEYVEFLSEKGFIPPDGKEWVDHIRKKGNEATHEIAIMKKEDAEELLSFVEMLLKFIYEFPATIKRKSSANTP